MLNTLIVGAGSGVGLKLAESLIADGHKLWTTSRSPQHPLQTHHSCWEANTDFPTEDLPDTLACMVYCPGTISLQPFHRTDLSTFVKDIEINLFGAVRALTDSEKTQQHVIPLDASVSVTILHQR
ncbi:MAG: hypothetical protein PVI97_11605 [Candidatus Thiodiazotropha sp.]|jgi:short-subunit dehydrogenase